MKFKKLSDLDDFFIFFMYDMNKVLYFLCQS